VVNVRLSLTCVCSCMRIILGCGGGLMAAMRSEAMEWFRDFIHTCICEVGWEFWVGNHHRKAGGRCFFFPGLLLSHDRAIVL